MNEPIPVNEILARQRAAVIVQVLCGQITAKEAAAHLGVSRNWRSQAEGSGRQTYYQWEKRAMAALVASVKDRPGGRPANLSDPEKQTLQNQTEQLQGQVSALEQALAIHRRMQELNPDKKKT
jgi:transposase